MKQIVWCALAAASFGASAEPAAAPGKWSYGQSADQMSGDQLKFAVLKSDNSLQLERPYAGKNHGVLLVSQAADGGYSVVVLIEKGQIICQRECEIRVKFDAAEPLMFKAFAPADLSPNRITVRSGALFYDWLARSGKVKVQLTVYQGGSPVLEFSPPEAPKL